MNSCQGYFTQTKRSFVIRNKNTPESPYSFITNREWLLFYFREPTKSSRRRHEQRLRQIFGERLVTKTKSDLDEWTVKVIAESEARFLLEEVLCPAFP